MTLSTTRRVATHILRLLVLSTIVLAPMSADAQTADLTIVKDAYPEDDTPFPMFIVALSSNDTTFFTLSDPSNPDTTFLDLQTGEVYQIFESPPQFWIRSFPSGDFITPRSGDSLTVTVLNTKFGLAAVKTDSLIFDRGTQNVADAGDSLKYTIRVFETVGPGGTISNVTFQLFDTPDPSTTLVAGTVEVMPSSGFTVVIFGNGASDTQIWLQSSVVVGDTTTITFKAVVNEGFDAVSQFCNVASINGTGSFTTPSFMSDDPDDPTSEEDETCTPAGSPDLPVELGSFERTTDGDDVVLTWTTYSETNNAGFAIQMKEETQPAFAEIGFVAGRGTTRELQTYRYEIEDLEPGTYAFRLKQIDLNGAFHYSAVVSAAVEIAGAFYLSEAYPNPFNPSTTLRFGVSADQPVRVAVFDALGRQVSVLYDDTVSRDNVMQVHFRAANLPSGLYFIRASGTTFEATRTVTLLR